jgi:hypothetical protein
MALAQVLPKKWCAFRPQYIYGPWTNKVCVATDK